MQKRLECADETATSLAAKVLAAYRSGCQSDLRREIARTQAVPQDIRGDDAFESEKRDLLSGAVESLASSRPERVRAALHVLDHLAKDAIIVLAR